MQLYDIRKNVLAIETFSDYDSPRSHFTTEGDRNDECNSLGRLAVILRHQVRLPSVDYNLYDYILSIPTNSSLNKQIPSEIHSGFFVVIVRAVIAPLRRLCFKEGLSIERWWLHGEGTYSVSTVICLHCVRSINRDFVHYQLGITVDFTSDSDA